MSDHIKKSFLERYKSFKEIDESILSEAIYDVYDSGYYDATEDAQAEIGDLEEKIIELIEKNAEFIVYDRDHHMAMAHAKNDDLEKDLESMHKIVDALKSNNKFLKDKIIDLY